MSIPSSAFDIDILSTERLSYGRVLVLELKDESTDNLKVSLVRMCNFEVFGDDTFAEIPRDHVTRNAVSLDGSRCLVGADLCKIIEAHSGNCLRKNGAGPFRIANGTNKKHWPFTILL
jgi:hypothetical protein